MSDLRVLTTSSVRTTLRAQAPLLALMALVLAALLVANGVVVAGVARYAQSVQYRSALNLIQLSSVTPSARTEITARTLQDAEQVADVTGVYPWTQVDLALSDPADWPGEENPGSLWATPLVPGLVPEVVAGMIPDAGLADGEIALPHTVPGGTLDALLGKEVMMEYTKMTGPGQGEPAREPFRVVAIVDNSIPGEAGPTPSYVTGSTVTDMVRSSGLASSGPLSYTTAYVRTTDAAAVPEVQRELAAQGFGVSSVATQLRSLGGLFSVLSKAGWVVGALLVLVCLAVGGGIGSAWVKQRTRELGLLAAVGWSRRRILGSILLQLGSVGLITAVVGAALGAVGSLVVTGIVAGLDLDVLPVAPWRVPAWSLVLLAVVLVPLCVCLGGLRGAVRAVRIDPDDALRDL